MIMGERMIDSGSVSLVWELELDSLVWELGLDSLVWELGLDSSD